MLVLARVHSPKHVGVKKVVGHCLGTPLVQHVPHRSRSLPRLRFALRKLTQVLDRVQDSRQDNMHGADRLAVRSGSPEIHDDLLGFDDERHLRDRLMRVLFRRLAPLDLDAVTCSQVALHLLLRSLVDIEKDE